MNDSLYELYKDGKKVEKPYPPLKWTKNGQLDSRAKRINAGYELKDSPLKTYYDNAFLRRMTQENPFIKHFLRRRKA